METTIKALKLLVDFMVKKSQKTALFSSKTTSESQDIEMPKGIYTQVKDLVRTSLVNSLSGAKSRIVKALVLLETLEDDKESTKAEEMLSSVEDNLSEADKEIGEILSDAQTISLSEVILATQLRFLVLIMSRSKPDAKPIIACISVLNSTPAVVESCKLLFGKGKRRSSMILAGDEVTLGMVAETNRLAWSYVYQIMDEPNVLKQWPLIKLSNSWFIHPVHDIVKSKFGSRGSAFGKFDSPCDVAVNSDREIIVANTNNNRIEVLDCDGKILFNFGRYGKKVGQFINPRSVAVNKKDEIIVCDTGNSRIQVFNKNGSYLFSFKTTADQACLYGVATDSESRILVSDTMNCCVSIFSPSGKFLFKFGKKGRNIAEFNEPRYIACTEDDDILVTDIFNHRVQVFNHSGSFIREFGYQGDKEGQFKYPTGVAVDKRMREIIVSDRCNNRVQVFTMDGQFLRQFASRNVVVGLTEIDNPRGVAMTADGHIVIAEYLNHRIQVI